MKKKLIIIISIVILTIINVFIVFKKDASIVEKNKVNKIERKEFSIYKEQTLGGKDWELSTDTTFPTSGYLLNNEQSKCYGYNKEPITPIPVKQELTKGSIDGRVTIESSKTIYCELYFDIDNKEPEVNKFSITGKTSSGTSLNNGFTYQTDNIPYTLEYVDTDVTQYCISDTSECTEWKEISEKTDTLTIDNSDGEKTMYIYLKDKANNVSVTTNKSTAKITVDQTKPVVKTFKLTGKADEGQQLSDSSQYTHKAGITYDATITESNIDSYCVYEDSCNYQTTSSTTLNTSYTLKDTEGSHSVKIRVKDKAGNESEITTQSIKLDKTNPTATIKSNSQDTSSITVTVGYEGQDSIIKRQCRLDTDSTWTDSKPDGSCTISDLKDGKEYTIKGRVRDASGRWNTTYPNVSVTTQSANFQGTGKQLLESKPKGLSGEPDCQGMYRFVGTKDDVNNYVCFGYTNISQCSSGAKDNEYIYRIIGINSNGEIKLIKNKTLSTPLFWYSTKETDFEVYEMWNHSTVYVKINGSEFLTGLPESWQKQVISSSWSSGALTLENVNVVASEVCMAERNLTSIDAKVGLMTLSDYYYANGNKNSNCFGSGGSPACSANWMFFRNNGCLETETYESTMIQVEGVGSLYFIYAISSNGGVVEGPHSMNKEMSVRPVFYLSPSTSISSGRGTSTDPFIVDSGGGCSGSGLEQCVE